MIQARRLCSFRQKGVEDNRKLILGTTPETRHVGQTSGVLEVLQASNHENSRGNGEGAIERGATKV